MVRLASLVFLSSLSVSVYSSEHLKVHGFLAQGVIQAADSNFVNDDRDVSLELTEVGINASYRLNSSLRVAGQGVYVNGGNRYPEGASIDYLFLDWQVVNNCDWNIIGFTLQRGMCLTPAPLLFYPNPCILMLFAMW